MTDAAAVIGTKARLPGMFRELAIALMLFAVAGLAHFTQYKNLGLYSDDQTFAVPPLTWTIHDVTRWINTQIRIYPEPQGRPLGFLIGLIIPYFGNQLGGLPGMFLIGWVILSVNSILFYHLLRRCLAPPLPLLGALFFLLFPADTTREFLCHAHILQPSLTFMLIAGHLYLSGYGGQSLRRWVMLASSYLAVTACLVTYETALLPFLAMPLLVRTPRNRQWKINAVSHLAVVLAIVVAVYITRARGHEYRAVEASASKAKVLSEIAAGTLIGPAAIAEACIYRAYQAVRDLVLRPAEIGPFVLVFGLFGLTVWLALRQRSPEDENAVEASPADDLRRAFAFGIAATAVSYLFCFTHFPPGCIEGQETSVHLAAVIGAATVLSALSVKLLRWAVARRRKAAALLLLAFYLSLIFKAALDEQHSYALLWRQRQQFWTRVFDLCPDLTEGTTVICDGMLQQPVVDHHAIWFMPPNCWADSLVLRYSYRFPAAWKVIPQVSSFPSEMSGNGWRTWLKRDDTGQVVWSKPPYGRLAGDALVPGNTILLEVTPDGRITRRSGEVMIAGKPFRLSAPTGPQRLHFSTLPLYSLLIGQ